MVYVRTYICVLCVTNKDVNNINVVYICTYSRSVFLYMNINLVYTSYIQYICIYAHPSM